MCRRLGAVISCAAVAVGPARAASPPKRLAFDAAHPPAGLAHQGKVVAGARWRDRAGENVVLLCETGGVNAHKGADFDGETVRDAEVYAYQYVRATSGATWQRVWTLTDAQRDCGFDLYAGFVRGALTITDLDGDGVAEVTFLYTLACRSDVSPATRKLILREGKDKYALRGKTKVRPEPNRWYGGEKTLDPAFARGPAVFKAYALKRWDAFVKESAFPQM